MSRTHFSSEGVSRGSFITPLKFFHCERFPDSSKFNNIEFKRAFRTFGHCLVCATGAYRAKFPAVRNQGNGLIKSGDSGGSFSIRFAKLNSRG